MAAKNKKREENLATELQQRDEEWREGYQTGTRH